MNCPYNLSGKVSCSMPLFIFERGKRVVPTSSGLNWGLAALSGSHVNIDDAYIRISTDLINRFPDLFPPKLMNPTNYTNVPKPNHRDNDDITIVWDDGTRMTALLEGSVPVDTDSGRLMFPKQISSTPKKASLGIYLRNRLQVASGVEITYEDLEKYGRTAIQATLIDNGLYYFDFSKPDKTPSKTVAMKSTTPPPVIHVSDKVKHKTYGIGIVESLSDNYIYVNFNGTIKPFQFPKSFETGFLSTFEDGQ